MAIHGTLSLVVGFGCTVLSTVVVALRYAIAVYSRPATHRRARFYSRYFLVRKIGSPDWVMLAALVSLIGIGAAPMLTCQIATWCSAVVNYYVIHFQDYSKVHASK